MRERCNSVHNEAAMTTSPTAARALVESDTAYQWAGKQVLEK